MDGIHASKCGAWADARDFDASAVWSGWLCKVLRSFPCTRAIIRVNFPSKVLLEGISPSNTIKTGGSKPFSYWHVFWIFFLLLITIYRFCEWCKCSWIKDDTCRLTSFSLIYISKNLEICTSSSAKPLYYFFSFENNPFYFVVWTLPRKLF